VLVSQVLFDLAEDPLDRFGPPARVAVEFQVEEASSRLFGDASESFPVAAKGDGSGSARAGVVQLDEVDRQAQPLRELAGLLGVGTAVLVGAVGDDDERPPAGLAPVLQEGEEESIVQGRAAHRDHAVQSLGQEGSIPRQRLDQPHRVVEVDQEGPVVRRHRGRQEAPSDVLQAAPGRQHAVRRIDREPQNQGHVVGRVEGDRGAAPAVFAYLEVLGREPAHRIAVAIRHQHLELGQLDVDLALVVGAVEKLRVFPLATVGEPGHYPDEVVGQAAVDHGRDLNRAGGAGCRFSAEVAHRLHESVASVEVDLLQRRGSGQRKGCRDPDRGVSVRLEPAHGRDADDERPVHLVEQVLVTAEIRPVAAVCQNFELLLAWRFSQADASPEGPLPDQPDRCVVEKELDFDDSWVDDQRFDFYRSAEQFAVSAFGRHDANGGCGIGGKSVRVERRSLVDRVDFEQGQAPGFDVGPSDEPFALPEVGVDLPPVRSDHLDRERFAGLEDPAPDATAEAPLPAVVRHGKGDAAAVEEHNVLLENPYHERRVAFGECLRQQPHRRQVVLPVKT